MRTRRDTNTRPAIGWSPAGTGGSGSATSSRALEIRYIAQGLGRIIGPVIRELSQSTSQTVATRVRRLVNAVGQEVLRLSESGYDIGNLPPLHGTALDGGSFLIEWLASDYRVGFVLDPDPAETMWYLLVKGGSAESSRSGSLDSDEEMTVVSSLVSYVASHS